MNLRYIFRQNTVLPEKSLWGAEALVRWVNNENGVITPDSFIPIIEQNGFITKLDDYMISGVAGLIPHNTIEFELTESAFFDDKRRIIETVKELQSNGFSVSMDDFGSGYFFAKPEPVKEFESRHLQKIQKI